MSRKQKYYQDQGGRINNAKKAVAFKKAFIEKTKKTNSTIKPPKVVIEDVEDAYTYYVLILKIPEHIFWYADYSFLLSVIENKSAYDGWLNYEREKAMEK